MNWPEMEVEKLLILNVSQSAFLPIPFFVRGIHKPRGQEDGVPEISTNESLQTSTWFLGGLTNVHVFPQGEGRSKMFSWFMDVPFFTLNTR